MLYVVEEFAVVRNDWSAASSSKLRMIPPMSFPNFFRRIQVSRNVYMPFAKKSFISLI